MKAIVCVKQVPDTSGKVAVNPDGTLNRASMATIINPDDKNAVEAALKLNGIFEDADRAAEQVVVRAAQRVVRRHLCDVYACQPVRRAQQAQQHHEDDQRDVLRGVFRRVLRALHAGPSSRLGVRSVGRVMVTVVPLPYSLASAILPSCCSTISLAIARPSPVPPAARLLALSTR